MTPVRRRQRGVTLLEALIAVALLAALSAMLAPAIHSSLRLSTRAIEQAERNESLRIAEDALAQILSNAIVLNAAEQSLRMTGDEKSLSITSLAGSSVGRRFLLRIQDGRLMGEIAALHEVELQGEATEILASDAQSFAYFGRVRPDAPMTWTSKWNSAFPPRMVRLEIAGNHSSDKDILIEVPITVSAPLHCAFDPVSRQCRN